MTNRLDTLGPHARASESPSHARLHVSRTGAWIYRTTTALMHTLHYSFPRQSPGTRAARGGGKRAGRSTSVHTSSTPSGDEGHPLRPLPLPLPTDH
jgi:hypothetical protein